MKRPDDPYIAAVAALKRGDRDAALRQLDRAWRAGPDQAACVGPLYAEQLIAKGLHYNAAIAVLKSVLQTDPGPITEALLATALLRSQRMREAADRLHTALHRFCVEPGGTLATAARECITATGAPASGWAGWSARLRLVGEVTGTQPQRLRVHAADGRLLAERELKPRAGKPAPFTFTLPRLLSSQALAVQVDDKPLLGSGLPYRPDFDVDGRASESRGIVSGWVRVGWNPAAPAVLCLADRHGSEIALPVQPASAGRRRSEFSLALRGSGLRGDVFTICAVLPDGSREPLPDAPLLRAASVAPDQPPRRSTAPTVARASRSVDIVIPVYLGREDTLACIESVLAAGERSSSVVVIDDASPDAQLAEVLDRMAADGRIHLLRNETNRGFAASVNRGLALHPERDAVLLNADTLVHGDWLRRLRVAAYSAPDIGSVTPFTSDGSIASVPRYTTRARSAAEAVALDRLAASVNRRRTAELPAGVGFCLYLRRDCLNAVGELDDALFGRGYGEEVDFCLRAAKRGWRHLLAADIFVLHSGGRSFGKQRQALLERSQRLLNLRHPGFDAQVQDFDARDPARVLRRRLSEPAVRAAPRKRALLVSLALRGGVERVVTERSQQLRAQGYEVLVLQPEKDAGSHCVLKTADPDSADLRYDIPAELDALLALLRSLDLAHTEIHHFLGLDPQLIEGIRRLRAPYDVYIHDYVWICPQITLIDRSARYCGEPPVSVCEICVKRLPPNLKENIKVAALRRRSALWLAAARRVVAPSADVALRLARYFPKLTVQVEALQPDSHFGPPPEQGPKTGRVRVALIGAIGDHKGYQVLLACAKDAALRKLPLEFTVLGYTQDDEPLLKTGRVFITGAYVDVEVPHLLRREQPHVILLPSVWPETWNFTLTHALQTGLPIISFDIGAIAERLRSLSRGELLPLDIAPARLNDRLLAAAGARTPLRPTK